MNVKLTTAITAGVMLIGTAVPVLAIPATLPIDYRIGPAPGDATATGLAPLGANVTQYQDGLGVDSLAKTFFPPNGLNDDPHEVGPGETLKVQLGARVTGVWLLRLFQESLAGNDTTDAGQVHLYDSLNNLITSFSFNGTGNIGGTGEKFVDFGGALDAKYAIFSASSGSLLDQIANKDYSVAGFTTAPDGGSNLVLLGSGLCALGLARRRFVS